MTISKNILAGSGAVEPAYEIEQSLMFEKTQGHGLRRTETSSGNRRTWTLSCWIKQATVDNTAFMIWGQAVSHMHFLTMQSQILVWNEYSGPNNIRLVTNRIFRDPSAWYHIVLRLDTTQATASDRAKMYVNGVRETSFSIEVYPSQNHEGMINNHTANSGHNYVGNGHFNINQTGYGFNGYIAEMNFIDGTALDPSSFGETSSTTGQWVPKKYEGSYGSKGYYLPFKSASDGYSVDFGGLDSSLTFPLSPGANFYLDADFTIECWVKMADYTARTHHPNILVMGSTQLYVNSSGTYGLYHGGDKCTVSGFPLNQWNHIAVTRDGNLCQLYLNGVRTAATYHTIEFGNNTGTGRIGAYTATTGEVNGNISNLRIVKGTAVYTGGSLTVPTANLTNITNTKLLCCQGSTTTSKVVGPTLTAVGGNWSNPVAELNSPYASYGGFDRDASGNGNDYNSFNLANFDVVKDSPTNNFCTVNSAMNSVSSTGSGGGNTITSGNLAVSGQSDNNGVAGTMSLPRSGKWYWEVRLNAAANNQRAMMFGIAPTTDEMGGNLANMIALGSHVGYLYGPDTANWGPTYGGLDIMGIAVDMDNGAIYFSKNNTWANSGNPTSGATKTGAAATTLLSSGHTWVPVMKLHWRDVAGDFNINFGQNSSFLASSGSGAGAADANDVGEFWYAPPSGYLALCTKNLPEPSAVALAPRDHFKTVTYTGTGSTQTVSGVGFQPDLLWIKRRDAVSNHHAQDTVRGISASSTKTLFPNLAVAEENQGAGTNKVSAVNSDGFVIDGNSGNLNTGSALYLTHAWKAGGTTPAKTYTVKVVSDSGNKYRFDDFAASAQTVDLQEGGTYTFDQSDSSNSGHPFRLSTTSNGTHASGSEYTTGVVTTGSPGSAGAKTVITVAASAPTLYYYCSVHSGMGGQVNTNSIFGSTNFDGNRTSIVSAKEDAGFSIGTHGHNLATSDTFGHGLGVPPVLIIEAKRDVNGGDWIAQHSLLDGSADYMRINTTGDNNNGWSGMNLPTSTVYNGSVGAGGGATNVVSYCFAEVPGYSKGGVYTGNGNIDGPFVHLGFEPAWILMKRAVGGTYEWIVQDNVRSPDNPNRLIHWFGFNYATNSPSVRMDFLSNGFKFRNVSQALNTNTHKYIYFAIAESPFKYANAQ